MPCRSPPLPQLVFSLNFLSAVLVAAAAAATAAVVGVVVAAVVSAAAAAAGAVAVAGCANEHFHKLTTRACGFPCFPCVALIKRRRHF